MPTRKNQPRPEPKTDVVSENVSEDVLENADPEYEGAGSDGSPGSHRRVAASPLDGAGHFIPETPEVEEIYQRILAMLARLDEQKKSAPGSCISFLDRLAIKLFGLTPSERYAAWDAQTLSWQERLHNNIARLRNDAFDFWWSTVGSIWDMIPPTLRPSAVERRLPHYRWCVSRSSGEIFLSGACFSAEKAAEEAQTVVALLKGIFEVLGARPRPAFSYTVYFENGTKVIPEINPDPEGRYRWTHPGASPRIVSAQL